nr:hypothetical protein [Caballeronia hypogeia]
MPHPFKTLVQGLCFLEEQGGFGRRLQAAGKALEQFDPEALFSLRQHFARGGLRYVKQRRGTGKRAGLHHCVEDLNVAQAHIGASKYCGHKPCVAESAVRA